MLIDIILKTEFDYTKNISILAQSQPKSDTKSVYFYLPFNIIVTYSQLGKEKIE